ncbi:Hpt domain-containing protein, partial [Aneurinibacillus terranovensis]
MEMNQYLDMFIEESKEHIQAINDHLLELENDPENTDIVNEIFRSAHTLKGMAATMGFEDMTTLTHEMENVLDQVRNHKLVVNSDIMDVIFHCVDLLEGMVYSIAGGGDGKEDVSQVVAQLQAILKGETPASTPAKAGNSPDIAAGEQGAAGLAEGEEEPAAAASASAIPADAFDEYEL